MNKDNTISTTYLSELDKQVLGLCQQISKIIINSIKSIELKTDFQENYGKLIYLESNILKIGNLQRFVLFERNKELFPTHPRNDLRWNMVQTSADACQWYESVEVFAVLSMSLAINFYKVEFENIFLQINDIIKNQVIDTSIQLPTKYFPTSKDDYILCPVCKTPLSNGISDLLGNKQDDVFSKITTIYLRPLSKEKNMHNAENVRYAHKWCANILNSRSVEDTIDTLSQILKSHNKNIPAIQNEINEITFLTYKIEKQYQTITTVIKQYFDYFSEYVRKVKGKDIYFYVKPLRDGFEFKIAPEDIDIVDKFLPEYANMVNSNINDLILNFENCDLPEPLKEVTRINVRQQLINLQNTLETANFEKKFYENQKTEYYQIITNLTEAIKNQSKQPIQIFNQSIPVNDLKQIVIDLFSEFSKIGIIRLNDDERIIDYYLRLDKIEVRNAPDYQKRISQWLPNYSELHTVSQTYLLSAEFLFDALFKADATDYSPFILQYCRVIENELLKQLFIPYYHEVRKNDNTAIQTNFTWDFNKINKNKDFASAFLQPNEPEFMLAKMLDYLKRIDETAYQVSILLSNFKIFIDYYFDTTIILQNNFLNKIDFVRENYRNKAAHPDKNSIKLNLSEAQKCQNLVREILKIWLESKK